MLCVIHYNVFLSNTELVFDSCEHGQGVCPDPHMTLYEAFKAVLSHFCGIGGQFTICASRWSVWGLWCVTGVGGEWWAAWCCCEAI